MKRKSPKEWEGIIQSQQASGFTAVEFCRQNNINPKYFSTRKSKLKTPQSPFISAKISNPVQPSCSLSWKSMRLDFSSMPDTSNMAALMKALNS